MDFVQSAHTAAVEVEGERIISVVKRSEAPKQRDDGPRVLDYSNAVIMPGLIDVYDPLVFHVLNFRFLPLDSRTVFSDRRQARACAMKIDLESCSHLL